MADFDEAMRRALMEDHAKLEALMGDDAPARPQFFDICDHCNGTGGSGETIVLEAPKTFDDPGYYEVQELPCRQCGGTGMMEIDP